MGKGTFMGEKRCFSFTYLLIVNLYVCSTMQDRSFRCLFYFPKHDFQFHYVQERLRLGYFLLLRHHVQCKFLICANSQTYIPSDSIEVLKILPPFGQFIKMLVPLSCQKTPDFPFHYVQERLRRVGFLSPTLTSRTVTFLICANSQTYFP